MHADKVTGARVACARRLACCGCAESDGGGGGGGGGGGAPGRAHGPEAQATTAAGVGAADGADRTT